MTPSQELLEAAKDFLEDFKEECESDCDSSNCPFHRLYAAISNFESAGEGETKWRVDGHLNGQQMKPVDFAPYHETKEDAQSRADRLGSLVDWQIVRIDTYTTVVATRSGKDQ